MDFLSSFLVLCSCVFFNINCAKGDSKFKGTLPIKDIYSQHEPCRSGGIKSFSIHI